MMRKEDALTRPRCLSIQARHKIRKVRANQSMSNVRNMNEEKTFSLETVRTMREELLTCQKEKNTYKSLYFQALNKCRSLQKELTKNIKQLNDVRGRLEKKQNNHDVKNDIFLRRKRKPSVDICSLDRKKLKSAEYITLFKRTIDSIPVCPTSSLTIQCPQHGMNMTFRKSDEAAPDRQTSVTGQVPCVDHTYSSVTDDKPEGDCSETSHEIYDSDGNFTRRHVRKAVLVTDNYRISNDAYHEIRSELSGHMPPIGRLKQEKAIMSEELPYQKHPKVSTL